MSLSCSPQQPTARWASHHNSRLFLGLTGCQCKCGKRNRVASHPAIQKRPARCNAVLTAHKDALPLSSCSVLTSDANVLEYSKLLQPCVETHDLPEKAKHITEVLAEQLAQQHIPLTIPLHFLPESEASHADADTKEPDQQLVQLPGFPSAFTPQQSLVTHSTLSWQHAAVSLDNTIASDGQQSMSLESQTMAADISSMTRSKQSPSQHLRQDSLCFLDTPKDALQQSISDWARTALMASKTEPQLAAPQTAEMLSVTNSRGHTWLGLTLRQAFLRRDQLNRDNEASVQDAAGGGGLLHGGPEDGGEGGGPSRGWGGAAGEEGDADEDDDDDDEDDDEDQDEDDDVDDSSSDGSYTHADPDPEGAVAWDACNAGGQFYNDGHSVMPAHEMAGRSIEEDSIHAGHFHTHAGDNGMANLCHGMLCFSATPPVQSPAQAQYALPFRTQRTLNGSYRVYTSSRHYRYCTHVAKGYQHNELHKRQRVFKSCHWSKLPQYIIHTFINIVGSSL